MAPDEDHKLGASGVECFSSICLIHSGDVVSTYALVSLSRRKKSCIAKRRGPFGSVFCLQPGLAGGEVLTCVMGTRCLPGLTRRN